MRQFVIPEAFFKSLAEKEKLYGRIWFYWLSNVVDDIFEPDFLDKQKKQFPKVSEITEVYNFGIQLLQNGFSIIDNDVIETQEKALVNQIIEYLNSKSGTSFSASKGVNSKLIISRIKEGYSLSEFKLVIDNKVRDWKDNEMQKYLRPLTLFNKSKFENYLNENNNEPATPKNDFAKFADSISKAKAIIGFRTDKGRSGNSSSDGKQLLSI